MYSVWAHPQRSQRIACSQHILRSQRILSTVSRYPATSASPTVSAPSAQSAHLPQSALLRSQRSSAVRVSPIVSYVPRSQPHVAGVLISSVQRGNQSWGRGSNLAGSSLRGRRGAGIWSLGFFLPELPLLFSCWPSPLNNDHLHTHHISFPEYKPLRGGTWIQQMINR